MAAICRNFHTSTNNIQTRNVEEIWQDNKRRKQILDYSVRQPYVRLYECITVPYDSDYVEAYLDSGPWNLFIYNVLARVTKMFSDALRSERAPLVSYYGAIAGLQVWNVA